MAKKNDSFYLILILLGFVVFIITKLVEFIAENIVLILIILGIGYGVFFVYCILKQETKRQPNKKSTKQTNIPLYSETIVDKQKTNYLDNSIIDINRKDIDELSPCI